MRIYKGQAVLEAKAIPNIRELVLQSAKKFGNEDAFLFRRAPKEAIETRSYHEFKLDVLALGEYVLQNFGNEHRKHIAIVDKNSYEWVVSHFAAIASGNISLPLDNQLPAKELINLLDRGDVNIFICNLKHLDATIKAAGQLEALECLIINDLSIRPKDRLPEIPELPNNVKCIYLSQALVEGKQARAKGNDLFSAVHFDTSEVAAIFFTSGTTAAAKGVMLSQDNILSNVHSIARTLYVAPKERLLSVLPAHHTFEHTTAQVYPLSVGACICYSDGLRYIGENLKEWQVSMMVGVPALFESMWRQLQKGIDEKGMRRLVNLARPIARRLEASGLSVRRKVFAPVLEELGSKIRLMVVGAAAADMEVIQGFNDLGITFYQGYGLTEHSPVVSTSNPEVEVEGSVGTPIADVEVAIAEDETLEEGQGEILIRSKSTMLGYYKNEEATRDTIDEDGWLHTGDMGYFDSKQCLHITGRYKSVIVLASGKKAFPEEIESLFKNQAGISACLVWGEENTRDQVDIAVRFEIDPTTLPQEAKSSDQMLSEYLKKQVRRVNKEIPQYKAIKYFVFSEEKIIRNTTLKIKRNDEIDRIHLELLSRDMELKDADGKRLYSTIV